jgi:hypothetical protein
MTALSPDNAHEPDEPGPARPTCKCGHDRAHYMVSAVGEYSAWGWFTVLFGISTRPLRLTYKCRRCNVTFDSTDDPTELDKHMGAR